MPTYASLADVEGRTFQNVQELAALWGEARRELEEFDVEILDTYAILGEYDFLILFEAPDRNTAYRAALTIEGYDLDLQTMEAVPTEEFAELVDDQP